jgi:aspartate aminotransferase
MQRLYNLTKPSLDGIMRINQLFNACTDKNKINLVIGAYRTPSGNPYIFESVEKAKKTILSNGHEYLPITGDNTYIELSKKLYFGGETNFSGVQSLSGTGSLYLVAQMLKETVDNNKTIFLPNPTWENHFNVFHSSGLGLSTYNHLRPNKTWNWKYFYDNIKKLPNSNIVLFHGCGHNPSGYDPSFSEWFDLINLCVRKNMLMIIDMAYLGFASGNIVEDSQVLRLVNNQDYPVFICTSYAKNFGLYSERVGNLFFRGYNQQDTNDMNDILRTIIRKIYSNPPSNGSSIIKTILSNEELRNIWFIELENIVKHYKSIRNELKIKLENKMNSDFTDITKQRGMFYYSKLSVEQVEYLRNKAVFLPDNGRISLAGLNETNMDKFVDLFVESNKKNLIK